MSNRKPDDWLTKHFIRPIMSEKPSGWDREEFAEEILDLLHRNICTYRVRKGLEMKGELLQGGVWPKPGITCKLNKGDMLLVRKDTRDKFYIVETEQQVYRVTAAAWRSLRSQLSTKDGGDDVDGNTK